jgi:hypothetical protein
MIPDWDKWGVRHPLTVLKVRCEPLLPTLASAAPFFGVCFGIFCDHLVPYVL